MNVWKLTEKYKDQAKRIDYLAERLRQVENYLVQITAPGDDDESVQSKQTKSSSVRSKRSSAKKS